MNPSAAETCKQTGNQRKTATNACYPAQRTVRSHSCIIFVSPRSPCLLPPPPSPRLLFRPPAVARPTAPATDDSSAARDIHAGSFLVYVFPPAQTATRGWVAVVAVSPESANIGEDQHLWCCSSPNPAWASPRLGSDASPASWVFHQQRSTTASLQLLRHICCFRE